MPALRGAPRSWVRFGRHLLAGTRVSALSPSDLFGDVGWDPPANARPEPDDPARPPAPPPADRPPAGRRRPSRRTFLIRRATALAGLAAVVGSVALGIAAGGGGDHGKPAQSSVAPAAHPDPVVPATVLDRLVAADSTLAPGDTGRKVARLQQTLGVLGMSPGPIDGVFSDGTRTAVAAFQDTKGIEASGAVDPATANALREALIDWANTRAADIRAGLDAAVAARRLPPQTAAQDGGILTAAVLRSVQMPPDRATALAAVLADVSAESGDFDQPRALTLFGMLSANARQLAAHPLPPRPGVDITGTDGAVYRFLAGHGYQFHPLANFARLNRYVSRGQLDRARALADALRARAVKTSDGGLVWEYQFAYGGPSRWTSALAQSAAAQALIRASRALHDAELAKAATAAFNAIPKDLARPLSGGEWVREYSWSDIAILNAQLQSIVSLSEYARTAHDARATAFVERLAAAARTMLPTLDTGNWSRYSVGGADASEHYHCYHVDLLERLADAAPDDGLWRQYARRWRRYADARGGCHGQP
jgi:D-glucuronyl C5-epimerase C-terminus/Putative peptidoglycan binding domain